MGLGKNEGHDGISTAASDNEFWKGLNVYGIEYKEFSQSGDD